MSKRKFRDRLSRRADHVGVEVDDTLAQKLEAYYLELARWNQKINLTAFPLESGGTDASVDRLLIEPLVAARYLPVTATTLLDIGSGGGSPAIPMKLVRPDLALHMVEAKVRKSVFLRQVARTLALERTLVENVRYEELLARTDVHESTSVLSIRAVRVNGQTLATLATLLEPGGQLFWFVAGQDLGTVPLPPLSRAAVHLLIPENQSRVVVLQKQ